MFVDVVVNDTRIARAEVVNETGGTDVESINIYRWMFDGENGRHFESTLQHRYGDGAIVLADLVIAAVAARYRVANAVVRNVEPSLRPNLEPFTPDTAEAFLRGLASSIDRREGSQGRGLDIGTLPQLYRRVTRRVQSESERARLESAAAVLRDAGRLP